MGPVGGRIRCFDCGGNRFQLTEEIGSGKGRARLFPLCWSVHHEKHFFCCRPVSDSRIHELSNQLFVPRALSSAMQSANILYIFLAYWLGLHFFGVTGFDFFYGVNMFFTIFQELVLFAVFDQGPTIRPGSFEPPT